MAAKDAKPAVPEGETPKKGKKLLIIVLALAALILALAVGAVWLLTSDSSDEGDEEEEEVQQTRKSGKKSALAELPIYVPLKFSGDRDTLTVNLAPDESGSGPFVQVGITLTVDNLEAESTLKAWMPDILNDINLIMSSKKESEVNTKEGKEAVQREIQDAINSIVSPPRKGKAPEGPVLAVKFTAFLIQ
ncbi:MAG: flagellar basal body-associated FliL family protein [Zoogloeaceae bacterium]|jgi:flagellar FliL protein|nr:flagellar basal body-associated FliL family protein [Zoogloeaceae bacterium]